MNKKFFTLLVALFAMISYGASAQVVNNVTAGSTPSSFSSTTAYLLEVKSGLYLSLGDESAPHLYALPNGNDEGEIGYNYASLQKALWYVKATTVEGNAVYEFTNAYTGVVLSLNSSYALSSLADFEGGENEMSGDWVKWNGSRGKAKPGTDFFFNYTNNKNNVDEVAALAIAADRKSVVALKFADKAAAQAAAGNAIPTQAVFDEAAAAADVIALQSKLNAKRSAALAAVKAMSDGWAEGDKQDLFEKAATAIDAFVTELNKEDNKIVLDGLDINTDVETYQTALGAAGALFTALADAQGVVNPAGDAAAVYTAAKGVLDSSETGALKTLNDALATAVNLASNAIEVTPKSVTKGQMPLTANALNTLLGTKGVYVKDQGITATEDSYFQLTMSPKNTIANPLTGELQAIGVDGLGNELGYDDDTETWVALYAKDNGYVVIDTAYIPGTVQENNGLIQTTTTEENWDENPDRLPESYLFQFMYDATKNTIVVKSKGYIASPNIVSKKEYWQDGTAATEDRLYLTYAKLTDVVAYTFGKATDMVIKLAVADASYKQGRVPSGVYLLKVVGSKDSKSIGKYIVKNLYGKTELIDASVRQNLQHMPAAQWVVNSTSSNYASIKNREFKNIDPELGAGTTYKTENSKEFFFLLGDTIAYEEVTATNLKNAKLGYKFVAQDGFNLDMYTFRYLHDLSMDNPVAVGANGKMFVNKEDKPTNFRLEAVTTVPYGYNGDLTGVAQLERTVYRIAAFETINFDGKKQYVTYDEDEKKYFLLDEEEFTKEDAEYEISEFLLKENNEVSAEGEVSCYYVFVEANTLSAGGKNKAFATVDKDNKITATYPAWVYGETAKLYPATWNGKKWVLNENGSLVNIPNGIYASSKVSVDPNTLALVNGVLNDGNTTSSEAANSAFKVGPDDSIIYRTIGTEEDENALEQNIRIYRINATAKEYLYEDANSVYSVGPNKPSEERLNIADQINFLGVEGKGDDKLSEAVMTARYVRGTVMPQYLLMLNYHATDPTSSSCPVCDAQGFITPGCPHHDSKDGFATARVLVSFADSVGHGFQKEETFKWNRHTRLGFVNAKFSPGEKTAVKDSILTILSSAREAKYNSFPVKFTEEATKEEGAHKPVFFSFRLVDENTNDFMLESTCDRIGGSTGGWVRIHNGVPVLCKETPFSDAVRSEAEIFNFETTDDNATSNGVISASRVVVEAGQGNVTISGAAGEQVVVANILGQVVYRGVLKADKQTIAAPAGVVVVSVAGEATKALVK